MDGLKQNEKLSSQSYWDQVLNKAKLPRVNSPKSYHYRVTMDFINKYIIDKKYTSFFEVGCGSSGWLPYFAFTYNLKVSGIDYSEIGCKLAVKNLEILEIPYGEIICKDLFEENCTNGKKYDIVFSYGVIEHFDSPEEVIRIFSSFLNPGGIMITLVPNLNGIMGRISKYYVPDIYKMHKVITKKQLYTYHQQNGLSNIKTDYAGTFTLAVVPLSKSTKFDGGFWGKLYLSSLNYFDKIMTKIFKIFRINIPSQSFSPYIISISQKLE